MNNTTISQIVLSSLQKYQISFNDVLLFITDNAAYMVKTFRNLSPIMPQMKHNNCLAHIMNLVVQEILKPIKAGEAETEDVILEIPINTGKVIPKVTIL